MRILMFFHNGSLNRGCEAIVRSGVAMLKQQYPGAVVNLVSFHPESDAIIPLIDTVYDGNPIAIKKFSPTWIVSALKNKLFKDETFYLRKR
ncbi:MAG: hypothetical protein K2P85_10535, partial [Flavobacteriaceae bacterium]|nr:hypothetical protein [Flavobacteriaceae bacterium]